MVSIIEVQSDLVAKKIIDFFKSIPENDMSFSGLKSQLQQRRDVVLHLKAIIDSIKDDEQTSLSQSRFVETFNKPPVPFTSGLIDKGFTPCLPSTSLSSQSSISLTSNVVNTSFSLITDDPPSLTSDLLSSSSLNDLPSSSNHQDSFSSKTFFNNSQAHEQTPMLKKLSPKEALEKILNCKQIISLEDMLKINISNKFFIVNNNFDHKEIVCNWKAVRGRKINFKILYNERLERYSAHCNKNQTLININDTTIDISSKLYKANCGHEFQMFVCHTDKLKLIQFLGQKPKCPCKSTYSKRKTFIMNKDLFPQKIYLKNPEVFKDYQDVSNIKKKIKQECPIENKRPKLSIADELKLIENKCPDGFFQESFKISNNKDFNSIDRDLPAIICYNKLIILELLYSALRQKLVLFFDKTYNTSIYHLSTVSFLSNRV